MNEKKLLVTYGEDLDRRIMNFLSPTAQPIAVGSLEGYRLVFQGLDRCGHANAIPAEGYSLPIVVWEIDATDERAHDCYMGIRMRYRRKSTVAVEIDGETREALFYTMPIDRITVPTEEYLSLIICGYLDFELDVRPLNAALIGCGYSRQWEAVGA